ncbi:HD family hydrolase [Enterovirga sp.]|uniref:HD family hydrolase n=1 Tax=Enterovirga sp. TaxID=2026350 RepID=UPI002BF6D4A9|nr:HD family hydrolase [Enterovirga sp.]HMO29966.1 HD family hydrolase [Enterovirga sp.]
MLSGRRLEILDPSPLDVELDDIAHGIARVARWNGQTRGAFPFSVAQHCCLVEAIAAGIDPRLGPAARLTLLLHDAAEYVVGDLVTPLKAALGEPFKAIEGRLQEAIFIAFGLPAQPPEDLRHLTKRADRSAAWLEATRLAGFSQDEARQVFGRPDAFPEEIESYLSPWPPETAQEKFRARVKDCLERRAGGDPCQVRGRTP